MINATSQELIDWHTQLLTQRSHKCKIQLKDKKTRVQNCPDITILNSSFDLCISAFVSFCPGIWTNVWRVSCLKSHPFLKWQGVITKGRYRAASAAKKMMRIYLFATCLSFAREQLASFPFLLFALTAPIRTPLLPLLSSKNISRTTCAFCLNCLHFPISRFAD